MAEQPAACLCRCDDGRWRPSSKASHLKASQHKASQPKASQHKPSQPAQSQQHKACQLWLLASGNLPVLTDTFFYNQAWPAACGLPCRRRHIARLRIRARTLVSALAAAHAPDWLCFQIGNVGFIGYSAAYSLDAMSPYLRQACDWAERCPRGPRLRRLHCSATHHSGADRPTASPRRRFSVGVDFYGFRWHRSAAHGAWVEGAGAAWALGRA